MNGQRLIVTPVQFGQGWIVFEGFRDGRVVTESRPMQKVGTTKEGNIIVIDDRSPDSKPE